MFWKRPENRKKAKKCLPLEETGDPDSLLFMLYSTENKTEYEVRHGLEVESKFYSDPRPFVCVVYTSRARGADHVNTREARDHESVKCGGEQRDKGSGQLLWRIGGEPRACCKTCWGGQGVRITVSMELT